LKKLGSEITRCTIIVLNDLGGFKLLAEEAGKKARFIYLIRPLALLCSFFQFIPIGDQ